MKPILKTTIAFILILSFHTGYTQTLTWTGNTNANWNTPSNWNGGVVPNSTYNVIIPTNPTRQPFISSANASCKSLTINSGATLTVSGYTLSVSNDINISGKLAMNNQSGIINAYGDVNWESGSTAGFTANTLFYVYGGWKFQTGSNVNLTYGTVVFTGPNTNNILCNSASSAFNNIAINKSSNAILGINTYSNFLLQINGYIDVYNGSTLHVYSSKDLIIKGNIISNGVFQCYDGTVKLAGTSQSLRMNTGDYFNNLTFNQSGTVTINNTNTNIVEVKKDVVINSGVFNMQDRIMRVGGNWTNTKGSSAFNAGTGRVIFNGSGHQYVNSSENFNILEIDKGAALRVDSASYIVICNKYEWKKGGIDVYKGTFTALDLVNNGIYGSYYVNLGGTINLHQDVNQYIDLNGKLTFTNGGTINIYGGSGYSYWARGGNAEINMSGVGAVLDFKNQGIYIYNPSSYTFTHNITGGTIRTSKGLSCYRTDFTPAGGTFEFYGSTDASLYMAQGSHLYEVKINKSSKEGDESFTGEPVYDQQSGEMISEGGKANTITLASNFVATGKLTIEAGNFNLSSYTCNVAGTTRVYGKLIMNNAANDLTTDYIMWDNGSSANVTAGTFHANYWYFMEGTTAKLGTGNTAYVTSTIYPPTSNDAEFGNLVLESSSKNITDDDNTKTYYPNRVMGNMMVISGYWSFSYSDSHLIVVGNLTIENGGNITFIRADLEVGGTLNLAGTLKVYSDRTATIQGAFIFPSTGWLILDKGTFTNNYNSSTTYTNLYGKLTMNNNSLLEFPGTNIMIENSFINEVSGGTLRFGRNLNTPNANNFKLDHGTVEFISAYPNHSVSVYNGNYLNDVVINKTGVSFLVDKNLVIKNDLEINSGVLNAGDKTISIGGNWNNNVGVSAFNEGTGRVIFNGFDAQFCSTEEFNILEVNKPLGKLYNYLSSNITCQVYDWTSGSLWISPGNFTAYDLADDGLCGTLGIFGGAMNLHQDANQHIDFSGDIIIGSDGILNIHGGSSVSYWPGSSNASLTMSGNALLDIKNQGIYVNNSHQFTANITGGTIKTPQGFESHRADFKPTAGTFEFYGSNDAYLYQVNGSTLYNVLINKSSKENTGSESGNPEYDYRRGKTISDGSKANSVNLSTNFAITNNLNVKRGELNIGNHGVSVLKNLDVNNGGNLLVSGAGSILMGASGNITINNGGLLKLIGDMNNQPKISRNSTGYYSFNIESGATLSANNTIFEYMNTNGVNVKSGAIVDPANAFTSCIFRQGQSGGRLLTLNNSQTLVIHNAVFPGSPSTYNVSKNVDTGMITFVDHSGYFSGASHEQDTFSRVHWTGELASSVNLSGVNIAEGQNVCFEALQTITTGGSDIFVVENGASANLVAGQKILMLPGTHAKDGSYLHALISGVGFCSGLPLSIIASKTEEETQLTHTIAETLSDERFFKIYPNPTTGIFTLELNSVNDSGSVKIEIFNLLGERILNTEQKTNSHYQFDLSGNKAGVYFIRVNSSGRINQKKLIKY